MTLLNRYRVLGNSGLKVSPLCLGTMTFGTGAGWSADEATSKAIFDNYLEQGGNFVDTAVSYTNGMSETLLGVRTSKQLLTNLEALTVELSPEQLQELDQISAIEPGFPHDFLALVRSSAIDGGTVMTA